MPRTPLSQFSDAEIQSEAARRRRALQVDSPPRPKVLRPCPLCGELFGARELKVHRPRCPRKFMP